MEFNATLTKQKKSKNSICILKSIFFIVNFIWRNMRFLIPIAASSQKKEHLLSKWDSKTPTSMQFFVRWISYRFTIYWDQKSAKLKNDKSVQLNIFYLLRPMNYWLFCLVVLDFSWIYQHSSKEYKYKMWNTLYSYLPFSDLMKKSIYNPQIFISIFTLNAGKFVYVDDFFRIEI